MKFKDPCDIGCPHCETRSSQRVAKLLALTAACPVCAGSLIEIGQRMRQQLDEWGTYVAAIEILIELEEQCGLQFQDEDCEAKTLRDVIAIVESRFRAVSNVADLVNAAAERARHSSLFFWPARETGVEPLDLDAPLIELFDPRRWERKSASP